MRIVERKEGSYLEYSVEVGGGATLSTVERWEGSYLEYRGELGVELP